MILSKEEPTVRIVALSGWKGSGKDTVADYLVQEYGYTKLSFAAALKDMVAELYNIPRDVLDNISKKEMPLIEYPVVTSDRFSAMIHNQLAAELQSGYWTPRALCILEGSVKRSVNSNFWVREVVSHILKNSYSKFVISDMRYISEAELIKACLPETKLVRIHRFESINTTDPSERDLDNYVKFDATVVNQGTLSELFEKVDKEIF